MNKNYARLTGGKLQYAPSTLITPQGIIMNQKRLSYLQAGWKSLAHFYAGSDFKRVSTIITNCDARNLHRRSILVYNMRQ